MGRSGCQDSVREGGYQSLYTEGKYFLFWVWSPAMCCIQCPSFQRPHLTDPPKQRDTYQNHMCICKGQYFIFHLHNLLLFAYCIVKRIESQDSWCGSTINLLCELGSLVTLLTPYLLIWKVEMVIIPKTEWKKLSSSQVISQNESIVRCCQPPVHHPNSNCFQ